MKQARLGALPGVVSTQFLRRSAKTLLEAGSESSEQSLIQVLDQLAKKRPGTEIIIETGIGKAVRKCSENPDVPSPVRRAARSVYEAWKGAVARRESLKERGPLQVQYDEETNEARSKSRRLLREALQAGSTGGSTVDGVAEVALRIEDEAFGASGKLLNATYRRIVRRALLKLRHRRELRRQLLDGSGGLTARQFVEDQK